MKNIYLLSTVFSMALAVGFNKAAYAVPCNQGSVSGSSNCQNGGGNNDQLNSPLTVNAQVFFGFDDWVYLQKDNEGTLETATGMDFGLTVTPYNDSWSASTGLWEFSSTLWDTYSNAMIVIKNGNNEGVFSPDTLLTVMLAVGHGILATRIFHI